MTRCETLKLLGLGLAICLGLAFQTAEGGARVHFGAHYGAHYGGDDHLSPAAESVLMAPVDVIAYPLRRAG